MTSRDAAKPFVWGGIALSIPRPWATGRLGKGYALLESQSLPVLEFKTAAIRGRFSFRRQMRQLIGSGRSAAGLSVTTMPPPDDWPGFPETADVRAFGWQGNRIGGRGLLVFCRECRRATLLQFYAHGATLPEAAPAVLASFRDHGQDAGPNLAVYDIAATLPDDLPLIDFRFEIGRFKLVFGRPRGARVTLWRLRPAKILLERHRHDLAAIARNNRLLPPEAHQTVVRAVGKGTEWRWRSRGVASRLKALLDRGRQQSLHALRIWQPADANCLLAVCAEALRDDGRFERICDAYGMV